MNYAPYLGAIRGEHVGAAARSIGAALIEVPVLEADRCSREGNSEMGRGVRIFDLGRMKQGRNNHQTTILAPERSSVHRGSRAGFALLPAETPPQRRRGGAPGVRMVAGTSRKI